MGWAKVPNDNQKTQDTEKRAKGEKLHLIFGAELAGDIMQKLDYSKEATKEVAKIIKSHMGTETNDKNTKILIDADALSDVFRDNFYAESKAYGNNLESHLEIRSRNKFFTKTAREIFDHELAERKREIENNASPRSV